MSRSWLIIPLLILYLLDLGGVGFISTDEPRYASIGREMARSGDWVTPRLDGSAWFEKPPLLYWMIAVGRLARLPDEWAARLPVALLSLAFLLLFFYMIAVEFSPRIAIAATTILATSAGWLAYSFSALTDLPMSALLGASLLVTLFLKKPWSGFAAGGLLGLSILAKAFVPVVLFAPVFFISKGVIAKGKRLAIVVAAILVAAPWHVICFLRYGQTFWYEYFWRQQFSRFFTTERQHLQHWWFYLPVLLAGLFPWIPLVALIPLKSTFSDHRMRYLGAWLFYGIAFFSVSQNKLPGYLLPLMPGVALLLAVGVDSILEHAEGRPLLIPWLLAASVASLVVLPTVVSAIPDAMNEGIGRTHIDLVLGLPFVLVSGAVWWLSWSGKPSLAILAVGMTIVFGVAYFKGAAFPDLDDRVSVRGFWRNHSSQAAGACLDNVSRSAEYGLNYYAGKPFHACAPGEVPRIAVVKGRLTVLP